MKRMIVRWAGALVALVLTVSGCGAPPPEGTVPSGVEVEDVTVPYRSGTEDGKLTFLEFTRYTGGFLEDGSGDPVEDVAAILVQNTTSEYLQYAQLRFQIGGAEATFLVTGLPPGARCWVLERDRLTVEADLVYRYIEGSTAFVPVGEDTGMDVELKDGSLVVRNLSETDASEVYVYYRTVHEDGNYFGGITYRCSAGALAAGEQAEVTAGHCDPEVTRVVRIERS
ncbi:MAG: hypothetical protein IJW45_09545 [Oscillospiraceae bacterium]|nr:hypothetical protein [Oscillospiraceae bacterium]